MAKIVKSTNTKSVNTNLTQKSDNGPPFNSIEMTKYAKNRNNEQVKIPPGHPAASNVENYNETSW